MGTAATTAPAPARYAAPVDRTAAPLNARLPTTASTRPAEYLWASAARVGSIRPTSPGAARKAVARAGQLGARNPDLDDDHLARDRWGPSPSSRPDLTAPNATVKSARTVSGAARPVVASRPDGTSSATTGAPASFAQAASARAGSRMSPDDPDAQERVDHQVRRRTVELADVLERHHVDGGARLGELAEPAEVGHAVGRALAGQDDRADPGTPAGQDAGDHQPVAAVVAGPDQDRDGPALGRVAGRGLARGGPARRSPSGRGPARPTSRWSRGRPRAWRRRPGRGRS